MPTGEVAQGDLWASSVLDRLPEVGVRLGGLPLSTAAPHRRLSMLEPSRALLAGPVVVYLPGRWCNSRLWAVEEPRSDLRVALAAAGYPTVTVGYRSSEVDGEALTPGRIATVRTRHLLADVALVVASVRRELKQRPVVLCGFSMGATLAFLAAADLPVQGVVAMDGGLPDGLTDSHDLVPTGVLANPNRHHRHVRGALARISAPGTPAAVKDRLRWRLAQDRWWPAAQVSEIRSGLGDDATVLGDRLRDVTCPILCFAADDRDPLDGLRAPRTAGRTRARQVRTVKLSGWCHEEVATMPRSQDDGLFAHLDEFLQQFGAHRGD